MIPVLYIVATPIGNLKDITYRAVEVLSHVDYILVEDKRQSGKLLSHYQIDKPLIAYHEHSDDKQTDRIVTLLQQGMNIALISDAGTPLISDPGYRLLQKLVSLEVKIVPIPGPSALIAAMSSSGLATDRFSFEGFLPAKKQAREKVLELLKGEVRTMVFYEAPHRIVDAVQAMAAVFGDNRQVCLARELTKTFETIRCLPAADLAAWIESDDNQQRGEIVLVVEGAKEQKNQDLSEQQKKLIALLVDDLPPKKLSKIVAEYAKINKKTAYDYILSLKS